MTDPQIQPSPLRLRLSDLVLEGPSADTASKRFADVAGIYLDPRGIDPDTVAYSVDVAHRGDAGATGNLYAGMTTIPPLSVNGEYTMTRGHRHADRNAAEVYIGVAGEGLLVLRSGTAPARLERVEPGSIHLIEGSDAHRLVNTGRAVLKVLAVWPTTAGYEYDVDFGVRLFDDGRVAWDEPS